MESCSFIKHGVLRLPPGFRFHPTDEELVVQYLRRKVFSCPWPAAVIPEIDLGMYDPWDLPGESQGERYFFDIGGAKYPNGGRRTKATCSGYWKATAKDKPVVASGSNELVGMKKVFVFHRGKPSHGFRTDWIMHQYCLAACYVQRKNSMHTKDWVVCRIFKKRAKMLEAAGNINRVGFVGAEPPSSSDTSSSSSSSSPSCVTDLSQEDGDEGSSNIIASSQ